VNQKLFLYLNLLDRIQAPNYALTTGYYFNGEVMCAMQLRAFSVDLPDECCQLAIQFPQMTRKNSAFKCAVFILHKKLLIL
jgi:hypothetical protein